MKHPSRNIYNANSWASSCHPGKSLEWQLRTLSSCFLNSNKHMSNNWLACSRLPWRDERCRAHRHLWSCMAELSYGVGVLVKRSDGSNKWFVGFGIQLPDVPWNLEDGAWVARLVHRACWIYISPHFIDPGRTLGSCAAGRRSICFR